MSPDRETQLIRRIIEARGADEVLGPARALVQLCEGADNGNDAEKRDGEPGEILALEDARVDLVERIREGIPERDYVPGGEGWLIPAKRYLVYSASGVGKTLGFLIVAVEIVRAGGTVAIIDVENGGDEYARRLEAIVGDDQELTNACSERLRYYEYPSLALDWAEADWDAALTGCDVVVFDSSRNVLSAVGLAEDANDDYARFMAQLVMPLSRNGKATVILDNCGHGGDHPRGASAKRDLNEILFSLSTPDGELDPAAERRLIWRRTRSRFAGVPRALVQRIGGGVYTPPAPTDEGDDAGGREFRPTVLMERISRYVEFDDGCSQTAIIKHVDGKEKYIVDAIQTLIGESYMKREPGPRNSKRHHSITPYREAEDDRRPTDAPTDARGEGVEP
jgi:hypothetical protein